MNQDNFFSIDRLIEFGMSMAVAQQMIKSMNQTIGNMTVAGAMNPIQSPSMPHIYYAMIEGSQQGPFAQNELSKLVNEKKIVKETYIWTPGMKNWDLAENIPDVLKIVALCPPPFDIGIK